MPPRGGLGARLLLAQVLVVLVGGATLLVVALGVAPALFREHVARTVGPITPALAEHLDTAFARAVLVALAVAMATATVAACAIGLVIARRVDRPIEDMSRAAAAVAAGDYGARVREDAFSPELRTLGRSFNRMARDLAATERTRTRLLRDLAHELRTPLTSVRGYHEAVADGVLPADPGTFGRIDAELSRVERLIEDLELVSRAQERQLDLRLEPVPVDALVRDAVDAASPTARSAGVSVTASADAGVWVRVDRDRMQEVLANLLSNAVRHSPTAGTVQVSGRGAVEGVEIVVADDGDGIAAEHLPHVFERFYRVDGGRTRGAGGSGIGLAVVRALVEAQGGHVRLDSPGAGRGTTAVVTLPSWPPPARAHPPAGPAAAGA